MGTTIYKYDLFISYSSSNTKIAEYIVEKIEKKGYKCFIAPRDIRTGINYASEIISGISNSLAVLLIFSNSSNKSAFVLREVNSAVSRNKTIIPFRIEDFLPSEAMEFYLGPTHWLDGFPEILDTHLTSIVKIIDSLSSKEEILRNDIKINKPTIVSNKEALNLGYDYKKITMREIELDYMCVPIEKFDINEDIEGTLNDWIDTVKENEEASSLLIENDSIIGYCDFYPITEKGYESIISGKEIIRDTMIDLYCLGGNYDAYISMIAIEPKFANQENYLKFFLWIYNRIIKWKLDDVEIERIGISVYSNILQKFVELFGFKYVCLNPAKGKVYETNAQDLMNNPIIKRNFNK